MPAIPKHAELAQRLEHDLRQGVFPGPKLPSNVDLAGRYGVNHLTLRKAIAHLEERGLVGSESRRGTYLLDGGLSLGQQTREIGILVENVLDREHPYLEKISAGLSRSLPESEGFNFHLISLPAPGPFRADTFRKIQDMGGKRFFKAFVLIAWLSDEEVSTLWGMGLPVVSIGTVYGKTPCVSQDGRHVAKELVGAVVAHGAKRVTLMAPPRNPRWVARGDDSFHLVKHQLEKRGISVEGLELPDRSAVAARDAYRTWLLKKRSGETMVIWSTRYARAILAERDHGPRPSPEGIHYLFHTDDDMLGHERTLLLPVVELGRRAGECLREQWVSGREKAGGTRWVPLKWASLKEEPRAPRRKRMEAKG